MHHAFEVEGTVIAVALSRAGEGYRLHAAGVVLPVTLESYSDGSAILTIDGVRERVHIVASGDDVFVHLGGFAYQLRFQHALNRLAAEQARPTDREVRAPMPGSLIALHVPAGQPVKKGDVLFVMESMKMETVIHAPCDGLVAIHCRVGQAFDRDTILATLEPEARP